MEKENFNEKKESQEWRKQKIKELEDKQDKTESEISFLQFLKDNDPNEVLKQSYDNILALLDYYLDTTPENIHIIALWIIGSKIYEDFNSFPYLFLNAMKGSGKSRTLRLIAKLGGGIYTSYVSEALIYRTQGLICIDEFENFANKDKGCLRELLNSGYKKGMEIMKFVKKKDITGEKQVVEKFNTYRPIAMANIYGMEEVLGDRCINITLEKSDHNIKTKLIENYDDNLELIETLRLLNWCRVCGVGWAKNSIQEWNKYLYELTPTLTQNIHNTTHTTLNNNTYTIHIPTNTTHTTLNNSVYLKLYESKINGRNLELFFPLLIISNEINKDLFDYTLELFTKMTNDKNENERFNSVDIMLYDFISRFDNGLNWFSITDLVMEFKGYTRLEKEWINPSWFGKALKRLNVIISKRRLNSGIEVILNVNKAKEKMKMFNKEEVVE